MVKNICLPNQKTQEMLIRSLGQKDSLEEEMATHSNILAWKIPWTEEPCGLQSTGKQSQRRPSEHIEKYVFLRSKMASLVLNMLKLKCQS